jgi:hypothetical protein
LPTLSARGYTPRRFVGAVLRANHDAHRPIRPEDLDPETELPPVPEGRPMTTAAPAPAASTPRMATVIISNIGLIVAVLSLPVVLLLGGPLNGWIVGVGLWAANWYLQLLTGKLVLNVSPTAAVGLAGISFISRAWLTAIVLFVIALSYDRVIGLTAAGVFLVAFTCDLAGRTVLYAMNQRATADTPR